MHRRRVGHSPAAWRGGNEWHNQDWIYQLTEDDVADLAAALAQAARRGKTLDTLQRADFPLPRLQPAIARWMTDLDRGRRFVLVRGVPVWRYTESEAASSAE